GRRPPRRSSPRGAAAGNRLPKSRSEHLPTGARFEPCHRHPGSRRALRRSRRDHPPRASLAATETPAEGGDGPVKRLPRGWRGVAWAGVLVGVLAALVALPPVEVRSPIAPVGVGLGA